MPLVPQQLQQQPQQRTQPHQLPRAERVQRHSVHSGAQLHTTQHAAQLKKPCTASIAILPPTHEVHWWQLRALGLHALPAHMCDQPLLELLQLLLYLPETLLTQAVPEWEEG
jgi:hypothetical protein